MSSLATVGGHHNNRDSSEKPTAIVAVTQIVAVDTKVGDQPEGQEQAQEEPDSSEGDMNRSRQPDVPVPSSPIPVRESDTFLEGRSVEADAGECRPPARIASRAESPAMDFARPESGSCVNIVDVTFLRVEGHRETARGPEYLLLGKMRLAPDVL